MNIGQEIREFIHQEIAFGDESVTIAEETPLYEGILDSLGLVDLVSFLENRFGIVIEDEDLSSENFRTVAAIQRLVDRRTASG